MSYNDNRGPFLRWLRPRGYRGELLVGPFHKLHPANIMYRIAIWLS